MIFIWRKISSKRSLVNISLKRNSTFLKPYCRTNFRLCIAKKSLIPTYHMKQKVVTHYLANIYSV